jgi:cobalt-zinc-cadmium efflux system membrane fusion protein
LLGWLAGRALPNLLILFALGGLASWGHSTGWKLRPFAELSGAGGAGKDDWCAEHGVPESVCVECDRSLLPRGKTYGWCKAHGVHECPLEHPDVAQLKDTPRITGADLVRARAALDFADRPVNHPKYKLHQRRLQFPSLEAVGRAGLKVTPAWEGPVVEAVAASGAIAYDPARVATLSTPAAGRVWLVLKGLGQPVRRGEALALVDAAEVGRAKAEFLLTLAQTDVRARTVERFRPLAGGAVARAELQKAEAELREAQIRLVAAQQALGNLGLPVRAEDVKGLTPDQLRRHMQFLGLPGAVVKGLDTRTATANLIPVLSPLDGVVVARKAVVGEQADAARALFVVADTRQMSLTLQVRQEEARLLRARDPVKGTPGQTVRFRPGGAEQEVVAELAWVSTEVDEKTRTVQARAALANPDGQLRANTFGSGRVILREEPKAVVVPSEAVQWVVDSHLVFVRDKHFDDPGAPKVFHPRTVRPGARDGKVTEIIAGVLPGEMVVVQGSGLLRSELLKNSLGEG